MIFYCGLLLLCIGSVRTIKDRENGLMKIKGFDESVSYSYWPSFINAAEMMRVRKREVQGLPGANEGGGLVKDVAPGVQAPQQPPQTLTSAPNSSPSQPTGVQQSESVSVPIPSSDNASVGKSNTEPVKGDTKSSNETHVIAAATTIGNVTKKNETLAEGAEKMDLSGPGVVKRGVIVFGGFALLAVAYFLFYRRKSNKTNPNSSHNAIDANQFRYGVLQSEDQRDNMENTRIPLTMESDDDEEDDLEIFDIEQKKKSMSYVNLQLHDDEIVNGLKDNTGEEDRQNLLLDIEDANSDALINWSNSGNKSIL